MNSPLQRAAMVLLLAGFALILGCAEGDDGAELETDTTGMLGMDEMEDVAVAQLAATEGHNVTGSATFTSMNGGIRVEATVSGLEPGMHGIHIHENGDCSAPDASSAGGHFAPEGNQHGAPDDQERHAGDLGNLDVGQDSTGRYSRVDSVLTFDGPNSIIGKALVIHSGEDDLTTQPSGNSGERVACGVIEMEGGRMGQMPGGAVPGDTMPGAEGMNTEGIDADTTSDV